MSLPCVVWDYGQPLLEEEEGRLEVEKQEMFPRQEFTMNFQDIFAGCHASRAHAADLCI